jgi:hypothetical protein
VVALAVISIILEFAPHNIKILVVFAMFFLISMITCIFMLGWVFDFLNKYTWLLFIVISLFVAYCGITFGGESAMIPDERYQ